MGSHELQYRSLDDKWVKISKKDLSLAIKSGKIFKWGEFYVEKLPPLNFNPNDIRIDKNKINQAKSIITKIRDELVEIYKSIEGRNNNIYAEEYKNLKGLDNWSFNNLCSLNMALSCLNNLSIYSNEETIVKKEGTYCSTCTSCGKSFMYDISKEKRCPNCGRAIKGENL